MNKDTLLKQLSNPLFLFCFIPGFYLLFGTLYAIQYTEVNWFSFVVLYCFILLNQLLEKSFKKRYIKREMAKKIFVGVIEALLIVSIIYFGLVYSITTTALLICYTLMIQAQYLFQYYELSWLSVTLLALFKSLLANSISFYIHGGFIPIQILIWTIPLILPLFFMESVRMEQKLTAQHTKIQLVAIYLVGVSFMWWASTVYAVILFISIPFAIIVWTRPDETSILLFTASYLLSHFITSLVAFINIL